MSHLQAPPQPQRTSGRANDAETGITFAVASAQDKILDFHKLGEILEPRMRLVLLAQHEFHTLRDGPLDADLGIIPHKPPSSLGWYTSSHL